jgi:AcrR family transcriptional regulator
VAAALEVLDRAEPSAVSLRDLARTVGVRHSALYSHFRDRGDLLAVIAGQGFAALLADMRGTPPSPDGRVAALAAAYVRFARAKPAYYRVMFLPDVSRPENVERIQVACEACFQTVVDALQESSALSEAEARERAVAVWSTLHGLVMLGDNSGPLRHKISPESEAPAAARFAQVLAQGSWPGS